MRKLSAWTDEYTQHESLQIIKELALAHAREGGTEGANIAISITSDDYLALCNWDLRYDDTASAADLYHCRQALAFYSKSEFVDIGVDREAVAFAQFQLAELKCRETNEIFNLWSKGGFSFPLGVEAVFYRAQRKISKILGDVPELSELKLRFGPGATTRTKKRDASTREKLQAGISCSEELFPYSGAVLRELPLICELLGSPSGDSEVDLVPVEVTTGRLGFVTKNAKTHRATVVEPVLNGLVQLGLNDYLNDRLQAFGINLKDQTINQRLAREGSLTGALATLDLSSASDTISRELVYHLLPLDWAHFLNVFRTRKVTYKGLVINQEKFSSMGNGFTFPLESMIFYALTAACCDERDTVSIYGDDIICPSARVPQVIEVLQCAGFTINTAKSYWSGHFRESCGADYFRGFDIRPYYQKKLVSPAGLFVLHNYYVRTCQHDYASSVLLLIHPMLHLFGPEGYGDGHLLGDWHPRPHKREIGYAGFLFDTFTLRDRRDTRAFQPGDGVLPYYHIYMRGETPFKWKGSESSEAQLRLLAGIGLPAFAPKPMRFNKDGSPCVSLPGSRGYKRISIYTLIN